MAYTPDIVALPADHWTDRAGQPIVAIVVHGTGGTDSRGTLQHGDGRGVSIHALIEKTGRIYEMLPDDKGANHAGAASSTFTLNGITYKAGKINQVTLGVELENAQDGRDPYTAPQLAALGWWITERRRRHGPLPLLRHADLDPTRRRDPYQLSTQQIEQTTMQFTDPWAAWGPIGTPTGAAVNFAVPRAWLMNKILGACVQPETYSASGEYSVTEFTAGIIVYFKARNVAEVRLF